MTFQTSQKVFCFLFSLVLPITFCWSAYNVFNKMALATEAKTMSELDSLALLGLIFCSLFFFGYAHYILGEVAFLQKAFVYMGWWSFLLIVKEFLALIQIKTMQILLMLFLYLFGLYLVAVTVINLRKLLAEKLMDPH